MKKEQLSELVKLVRKEADNIKLYAYPNEIEKLSFRKLKVLDPERCVYGQMTGDCYGSRASELIRNCATRVYLNGSRGLCEDVIDNLNGSPQDFAVKLEPTRRWTYHSPIELFVFLAYVNHNEFANEMLLDYIKGERKTFKPEFENELA